jgi:hypothetical protein
MVHILDKSTRINVTESDTFNEWRLKTNEIGSFIGDKHHIARYSTINYDWIPLWTDTELLNGNDENRKHPDTKVPYRKALVNIKIQGMHALESTSTEDWVAMQTETTQSIIKQEIDFGGMLTEENIRVTIKTHQPGAVNDDDRYYYGDVGTDYPYGYADNDILTIRGSSIGGVDGINDLKVKVAVTASHVNEGVTFKYISNVKISGQPINESEYGSDYITLALTKLPPASIYNELHQIRSDLAGEQENPNFIPFTKLTTNAQTIALAINEVNAKIQGTQGNLTLLKTIDDELQSIPWSKYYKQYTIDGNGNTTITDGYKIDDIVYVDPTIINDIGDTLYFKSITEYNVDNPVSRDNDGNFDRSYNLTQQGQGNLVENGVPVDSSITWFQVDSTVYSSMSLNKSLNIVNTSLGITSNNTLASLKNNHPDYTGPQDTIYHSLRNIDSYIGNYLGLKSQVYNRYVNPYRTVTLDGVATNNIDYSSIGTGDPGTIKLPTGMLLSQAFTDPNDLEYNFLPVDADKNGLYAQWTTQVTEPYQLYTKSYHPDTNVFNGFVAAADDDIVVALTKLRLRVDMLTEEIYLTKRDAGDSSAAWQWAQRITKSDQFENNFSGMHGIINILKGLEDLVSPITGDSLDRGKLSRSGFKTDYADTAGWDQSIPTGSKQEQSLTNNIYEDYDSSHVEGPLWAGSTDSDDKPLGIIAGSITRISADGGYKPQYSSDLLILRTAGVTPVDGTSHNNIDFPSTVTGTSKSADIRTLYPERIVINNGSETQVAIGYTETDRTDTNFWTNNDNTFIDHSSNPSWVWETSSGLNLLQQTATDQPMNLDVKGDIRATNKIYIGPSDNIRSIDDLYLSSGIREKEASENAPVQNIFTKPIFREGLVVHSEKPMNDWYTFTEDGRIQPDAQLLQREIEDVVGAMVTDKISATGTPSTLNMESGLNVRYDSLKADTNSGLRSPHQATLNFEVHSPDILITGDMLGNTKMMSLSDVVIDTHINKDSTYIKKVVKELVYDSLNPAHWDSSVTNKYHDGISVTDAHSGMASNKYYRAMKMELLDGFVSGDTLTFHYHDGENLKTISISVPDNVSTGLNTKGIYPAGVISQDQYNDNPEWKKTARFGASKWLSQYLKAESTPELATFNSYWDVTFATYYDGNADVVPVIVFTEKNPLSVSNETNSPNNQSQLWKLGLESTNAGTIASGNFDNSNTDKVAYNEKWHRDGNYNDEFNQFDISKANDSSGIYTKNKTPQYADNYITSIVNVQISEPEIIKDDLSDTPKLSLNIAGQTSTNHIGSFTPSISVNSNGVAELTITTSEDLTPWKDEGYLKSAPNNTYSASATGHMTKSTTQWASGIFSTDAEPGTSTDFKAGKIVSRNDSGDFYANIMNGTATKARYADLAENYVADKQYEVGTVLSLGGEFEVTESDRIMDSRIVGVVSENPAYLMNSYCTGEFIATVALRGRVPVKVEGPVDKGDIIISSGRGTGVSNNNPSFGSIIGKAVVSKTSEGTELIEVVIT